MDEKKWGGKRQGAGRKKTGRTFRQLTITLPIQEAELLSKYAEESGLSESQFIRCRLGFADIFELRELNREKQLKKIEAEKQKKEKEKYYAGIRLKSKED